MGALTERKGFLKIERAFPGTQLRYRFKNGYGASVVCGPWTHGGPDGLWELAVMWGPEGHQRVVYSTPITDDVIGWLTDEDVAGKLDQIEALPRP